MKMKVKEDKSGEEIIHKKNKNKHTSLPENKNSAGDDMTPSEMKKGKKKSKNTDAFVTQVESCDGGVVIEEKKKKKKRKSDTESLNDTNGTDVKNGNEEFCKKKKKKKKLTNDESTVETLETFEKEEGMEKKLKEKKVKNKSVQMTSENVNLQKEEVQEQEAGKDELQETARESQNSLSEEVTEIKEKVKEKKKKKKKAKGEENAKSEDETRVKKKKKKAKTEVSENRVELETLEGESSVVQEAKIKKKKRKLDGSETESPQLKVNNNSILKIRDESTEGEIVVTEDERGKQKKKGTREKNGQTSLEVSEVEETEPKKKKRKKGEKREHPELKSEEVEEPSMETSKNKKKKKSSVREETQDVSSETSTKKKVRKEENDEHGRKLASQMEVEQMSQPQKPTKPAGFGQWSTAQFSSSEQQQKFLRLMGGFKKSSQLSSESTGGAKMAMGKDAQQQLQQGLLGEFERAQSRRLDYSNRGAGLGFTAPSNKFSIDINASRSIRFDD